VITVVTGMLFNDVVNFQDYIVLVTCVTECGAMVEGCSRGKPELLVERSVTMLLYPPQIPPLPSDRPTSNRLSNGTAVMIIVVMMMMITVVIKEISDADESNITCSNVLIR